MAETCSWEWTLKNKSSLFIYADKHNKQAYCVLLMCTTTCFGRFLWPSSGSYTEYITPKVHHHVQAPPLQAVDIITSIKINNANGVEEH